MFSILDPTSVAIIIPTIVLTGLLLAAAYKTRRSLWPISDSRCVRLLSYNPRVDTSSDVEQLTDKHDLTFVSRLVAGEFAIFAVCFAVSAFLSQALNSYQGDCVLLTLPLICLMQFFLCKLLTGAAARSIIISGQFVFSVSLIFGWLLLSVPISQSLLISLGVSLGDVFYLKQLSRMVVAVSTFPMSMAGAGLAVHIERRYRLNLKSIERGDLSILDLKTVEEVQGLVGFALRRRQIEIADKISLYLLRRVERSCYRLF